MLYNNISRILTLIYVVNCYRRYTKYSVCIGRYCYKIIIRNSLWRCSIGQSYILCSCNIIRCFNAVSMIIKIIYSYSCRSLSLIEISYCLGTACECTVCVCRYAAYLKVCITFRTCCIWKSEFSCSVKYCRCTEVTVIIF